MIDAADMSEARPFDQLKLVLAGREKAWKSRTAASGRKPVLFFDFDQRREAVAGIPGVYALTFKDPGDYQKLPEAYENLIDVIKILEDQNLSLGQWFPQESRPVKTVVFDSIASIAKAAMNFGLYNTAEIRRTINIGGKEEVRIPKNFDAWNAEMSMVEKAIMRVMGLGVDTIVILHLTHEEAPESTIETPSYTGRQSVFPVRHKQLLKSFNEVWMMKLVPDPQGGQSYIGCAQTKPDYTFDAATALLLDHDEMRPNIENLIQKHINNSPADGGVPDSEVPF